MSFGHKSNSLGARRASRRHNRYSRRRSRAPAASSIASNGSLKDMLNTAIIEPLSAMPKRLGIRGRFNRPISVGKCSDGMSPRGLGTTTATPRAPISPHCVRPRHGAPIDSWLSHNALSIAVIPISPKMPFKKPLGSRPTMLRSSDIDSIAPWNRAIAAKSSWLSTMPSNHLKPITRQSSTLCAKKAPISTSSTSSMMPSKMAMSKPVCR